MKQTGHGRPAGTGGHGEQMSPPNLAKVRHAPQLMRGC